MTVWNGLWQKEHRMMRGWLYGTFMSSIAVSFVLPLLLTVFFEWRFGQIDFDLYFIPLIWLAFSVFIPLSLAMSSLNIELERPDVWFHTPASIFQLIGVKAAYAMVVGILNIVTTLILFIVLLRIMDAMNTMMTLSDLLLFVVRFIFFVSLGALIVLVFGLLFRVIHLVIRPYFRSSTILVSIAIFIGFMALLNWIMKTSLYTKISTSGPIMIVEDRGLTFGEDSSALEVSGQMYVGDLVTTLLFLGALFITAALLLEKKVRL